MPFKKGQSGNPATQFKPGVVTNPRGVPKGTKHLSTWIKELMNDEEFTAKIQEGYKVVDYKGAPIKAIIQAQMRLAINGDTKAFDTLGKYGWGTKLQVGNDPENPIVPTRQLTDEELDGRIAQIIASGKAGVKAVTSGTGPKKST